MAAKARKQGELRADREVLLWCRMLLRRGRVQLCAELPLFQLPTHDGLGIKPFAGIERHKLTVTRGQGSLLIVGDEAAHDAHCKTCGSLLYSVVREGSYVHVTMGTLVDTPTIRPTAHIFVGSKAAWYTITDDLPQFEGHVIGPEAR